ncbi:MAG: GNAT family N-acetyltransferase [Acidimicrobiales bacterium]
MGNFTVSSEGNIHTWQPADGDSVAGSSLTSSRITLREVLPSDYMFLYKIAADPVNGYRWRFRNSIPSFEEFVGTMRSPGMLMQLLVVSATSGQPFGVVICYKADFRNKHAHIAVQGHQRVLFRGLMLEAARLFIDLLFTRYEFNKLYAETYGFSLETFRSVLKGPFVEEGRMRNHEWYLGKWWDLSIIAVYREDWIRERHTSSQRDVLAAQLPFEEFVQVLGKECNINLEGARPDSRLIEDLDFDSLTLLEAVDLIESACGPIDETKLQHLRTIEDLHFEYLQSTRHDRSG